MTTDAERSRRVTRWGRAALLSVLFAGFLTMHGFVAVSATAADAGTGRHGVMVVDAGAPTDHPAPTDEGSAGGGHPLDHDLLAGCVVALVGVAVLILLGLAGRFAGSSARALLGWRHRVARAADLTVLLPPGRPRVALCVIRV